MPSTGSGVTSVAGSAAASGAGERRTLIATSRTQPTYLDGSPRGKVRTGRQVAMIKRAVLRATGWYNLRCPPWSWLAPGTA